MAKSPITLQAVVLDWAGTIIDHGSCAPSEAFREIFGRHQVPISAEEARGPMGKEKRDHIAALLAMPRIADAWREAHRRDATDEDIDYLYKSFLPVQIELLEQHADVIPGVLEALAYCRNRGIRIGSSSGYATPIMERLVSLASEAGLHVDAVVSASEVPAGRPAPWVIFQNMQTLGVYPPATVVTVDDTQVGIEAGRNAGTWSVGVVETGNLFGVSAAELEQLNSAERERRRTAGHESMQQAGAHYAIDSVAELPGVLEAIDQRLASGETP